MHSSTTPNTKIHDTNYNLNTLQFPHDTAYVSNPILTNSAKQIHSILAI